VDAELLIALERYDEAEELLEKQVRNATATGDHQSASMALEALGQIAIRRGREQHALGLLRQSLELADDPEPAARTDLYFELARLLASTGDADAAVDLLAPLLDHLRDEHPDDLATIARFAVTLSMAQADAGRYTEASQLLAGVLRDGGDELDRDVAARVNYALSRLNNTTGHYELAADYARRALRLNEETGDEWAQALCHLGVAHILLTIGDTEEAAEHLSASRALHGDRLGTVLEGYLKVDEARLALQRGDAELSVEVARDSVALLSNAAIPGELGIAQLALARGLDELGDDHGAEQAYTAAIDLFRRRPGWHRERARAHRWYGKFLRRHGRDEAALREFELAADLAPSNQ
jgi:tetratricopeptide (TPR) repeat protein